VAVEAVNVTTAVAVQAGKLLLAGVVQIADATAQELAGHAHHEEVIRKFQRHNGC
jgi:hypothetical protein